MDACSLPRLFAACCVFLRHSAPRHSPRAMLYLNLINPLCTQLPPVICAICFATAPRLSLQRIDIRFRSSRDAVASQLTHLTGGFYVWEFPASKPAVLKGFLSWFVHHKKNEKAKGPQQYFVSLKDLAHLFSCRFTRLLLRKEVIQPHLPVRLPCYDFTPLTRRTLDASFPYGLSLRLRVPPTRVV